MRGCPLGPGTTGVVARDGPPALTEGSHPPLNVDIIELIDTFNLYVLPPVVVTVVLGALLKGRRGLESETAPDGGDAALRLKRLDRERTVRRIGLVNYGLALRALVMVVPEFQAYAATGSFWSIAPIDVGVPLIVAAVSVPIGLGLRRLRGGARWGEILWSAFYSALTLGLSVWMWNLGAHVDAGEWPALAVSKVLPPFLLVVMLLPGTGKVVSAEYRALVARTPELSSRPVRRSIVSALVLGFLVIVVSVVIVDALDWAFRVRTEMAAFESGVP